MNYLSQRRFKALVEKARFFLVNDQIVSADGSTVTLKKTRAKKTTTSTRKKRNVEETEDAEDEAEVARR